MNKNSALTATYTLLAGFVATETSVKDGAVSANQAVGLSWKIVPSGMTKASHTALALQLEVHFRNPRKHDEWMEIQMYGRDCVEAAMIGWLLLVAKRKGPHGLGMRTSATPTQRSKTPPNAAEKAVIHGHF
jgi:hypothetical protein